MSAVAEFSKIQCLFTGNRFSGFNLESTKLQSDVSREADNKFKITVAFLSNISYLEVEDEVKYQQYATILLEPFEFSDRTFLIKVLIELKNELRRRYLNSNIVKFLEIKDSQDLPETMISNLADRMLNELNKR